ncbi:MAG: tripartite tricarboxylate transporter TctB family protein [Acetobacterales bacterium]
MNLDKRWYASNQAFAILLLVFLGLFVAHLLSDPSYSRELYDGFSLGFFPIGSVVLMMFFAGVMLIDTHRNERAAEGEMFSLGVLSACLLVGIGGYIYVWLLPIVGYLILTPVFLLVQCAILGMPLRWPVLVATLSMTVVFYVIFWLLGYPLPSGILPF